MMKRLCLFLCLLFFPVLVLMGQQLTRVHGIVRDAVSGEPVPFANITFPGFNIGTISSNDGTYSIETKLEVDSLMASSLGYRSQSFIIKEHADQQIDFLLTEVEIPLEEVVIKPGENPAHRMLRNIIANRERNNLSGLRSYQYKAYNKIRIDMSNVEILSKRKILQPFDFVFEKVDTNQKTGKTYLPVLLSESFSDYYYQDKPRKEKEFITASRISGTQNESLSQFNGKLYQKFSIYDNIIMLFEIGWVSPLSENGLHFYKYHLRDTAVYDHHTCYHIVFEPKRKQERTFTGDFWVADSCWAIKKINMQISSDANINFMHDLIIENEYAPVNDTVWFPSVEKMYVDLNLTKKTLGFIGRKVTTYQNIEIDRPIPATILREPNDLVVIPGSGQNDETYWQSRRPVELAEQEQGIYSMIDSVQQVPLFRTLHNSAAMLITNYYVMGPVEIGPYYRMYSFNPLEGNRFRIGGRTSNEFSTHLMLDGFLAYGTRDMRFKYGGGMLYLFDKDPRMGVGWHYEDDMRQLGLSDNGFMADNFLASFLRRNPNDKLTMVREFRAYGEKEWFHGLSNTLTFRHLSVFPTIFVPFNQETLSGQTISLNSITTSEITLNTRFAWQEKYLTGEFEKVSMGTKWPVVNLDLTLGLRGIYGSEFNYRKMNLKVTDDIDIAPYGYTRYALDAGIILGTLPYPMLELHQGNETYQYDYMGFNMMNYYEFVSDKFVSLMAEHHFDGFFFNHVPVLRRMNLREVATGRALWGSLGNNNRLLMQFPAGLSDVRKGYFEAGVGIENIFRLVRLDAIWRLSYLNHPNIQPFGLRVSMQIVL